MNNIAVADYLTPWSVDCFRGSSISPDAFIETLIGGGDSRLAVDQRSGVNKYLCAPKPADDLIVASSCTASPITEAAFQRCASTYVDFSTSPSPNLRWAQLHLDIEARLLAYFGISGQARAVLCPSGTDALLTATMMLASEQPGSQITAILPQASETGSGVPRAASLRSFDGQAPSDVPLIDCAADVAEIQLRCADGTPKGDDDINAAFAAAAVAATGRPIVFLTHGTKTGLIAPVIPPPGPDVIVDACQARIEPSVVARYLRNGWPVVITGSKFFGGPAFSGAVLFPAARLPRSAGAHSPTPNPGALLRWLAALDAIEAFAPVADRVASRLQRLSKAVEAGVAGCDNLVSLPGLSAGGTGWSDIPTIFSFAVRDPLDCKRLLSFTELRPIYTRMAERGVLLGQPVEFGEFGGLRIAIGARDLLPGAIAEGNLEEVLSVLREVSLARMSRS